MNFGMLHWGASEKIQDEELECDRYALNMMIEKISEYAAGSGYPARGVLAKRLLGILFAKLAILTITPEHKWSDATDHPSVKDRIRRVLEAVVNLLPDWFWPTSASLLAAFARYYGLIDRPIGFGSSRELAFILCDKFDARQKEPVRRSLTVAEPVRQRHEVSVT
jgi:hypothetical protein